MAKVEGNTVSDLSKKLGETLSSFYDQAMFDSLLTPVYLFGEPKYRKQRVPVYFKIKVPVFTKHTCYSDWDYGASDEGYLLTFKEIKLFKIGSKVEVVPYWSKRKSTGKTLTFKRYSPLVVKKGEKKKNG